ncbi:MAG: polyphenol oxidase family protein [bacterium]|nr:polyphenol oxidase family protein [bacterium]
MIRKDIGIGQIVVTDSSFGHVGVGDETFLERFERKFDWLPERIAWMNQVHSPEVKWVGPHHEPVVIFPQTDGEITDQSGTMLITKTADCVPILLWSEPDRVIAALHCGWKGFFRGIIESFAEQCALRGLEPGHFSAFLGPHLRVENFEVREDFMRQIPETKRAFLSDDHYDMTRGVISTLRALGIEHVDDCGINTYGNSDFFSYRTWCHQPESERSASYSTFANCIVRRVR